MLRIRERFFVVKSMLDLTFLPRVADNGIAFQVFKRDLARTVKIDLGAEIEMVQIEDGRGWQLLRAVRPEQAVIWIMAVFGQVGVRFFFHGKHGQRCLAVRRDCIVFFENLIADIRDVEES